LSRIEKNSTNAGMKDLGGRILYMYEDTSLRAEETNPIRRIKGGKIDQKYLMDERKKQGNSQTSATCDPILRRYTNCTSQGRRWRLHLML